MTEKTGTVTDVNDDHVWASLDDGPEVRFYVRCVRSADQHLVEPGRRVLCTLCDNRVVEVVLGALVGIPERVQADRMTGVVAKVVAERGFAFIVPEGGGKDVFVHFTAFERAGLPNPAGAERLSFVLVEGRRGRKEADRLRIVESAA